VFTTSILVRFGDLDAAGIAYYPKLVNFLHEAFEDFFAGHVGRPYPEVFRAGLGLPTVRVEVEFLSPVHYGDRVDIQVGIQKIGASSVEIRYAASVEGRPVFQATNTAVVVDMSDFRPRPIPDWLRARFEAGRWPAAEASPEHPRD
jgi:4-hydroxybenzoyl-CoA thioesterase